MGRRAHLGSGEPGGNGDGAAGTALALAEEPLSQAKEAPGVGPWGSQMFFASDKRMSPKIIRIIPAR